VQSRPKLGAWLFTPIVAALLFGCAVVDEYSGRAITYNLEAEQAQDQALLLNVVRAYLRRPMQFTTVSTITGIASATGSVQYSLPTNVPFRPATQGATGIAAFPPVPSWLFGGSMSGGPVFTVPVLDTQEFYQGILRAIPGQLWDLYLQANYPPDFLFNLFVQKIVMHRAGKGCDPSAHTEECEFVFLNYPGSNVDVDLFQTMVHYLLTLGLTTEAEPNPKVRFRRDDINIRYVGNPDAKNKNLAQVVAPPGGTGSDAPATLRPYKICFAPQTKEYEGCVVAKSLCGMGKKKDAGMCEEATVNLVPFETAADDVATNQIAAGSASADLFISNGWIRRLIELAEDERKGAKETDKLKKFFGVHGHKLSEIPPTGIKITISMRHTEGIIYYLGELARRALNPDLEERGRYLYVKRPAPFEVEDYRNLCGGSSQSCYYIFRLFDEPTPLSGEFATVNYAGRWYSISGKYDPKAPDLSSLSLDITKQLIALNSSAKSLPQSSVITAVGQ